MKIALLFLAFLAASFAQTVSFTDLSFNGREINVLTPTTSDAQYELKLYRIWIPENTSLVKVSFETLDTNCGGLQVYARTGGFPCGDTNRADQVGIACYGDSWSFLSCYEGSSCSADFEPDTYGYSRFRWTVNDYWYFGVGRYSSSYYDQTCSFTLTVELNETCAAGSVATYFDQNDTNICLGYDTASSLPWSKNVVYAPQSRAILNGVRYLPKDNTGKFTVTITTNTSLDIYGTPYAGATDQSSSSYATRNFCEDTTYEYNSTTGVYVYSMHCFAPRPGNYFYIGWNSDSSDLSDYTFVNVTVEETVCSGDTLGPNCEYPLRAINSSNVGPYSLNGTNTYDYAYFYVDFPGNNTGTTYFNFSISAISTGSGYLYWRRKTYDLYSTKSFDSYYEFSRSLSSAESVWATVLGEDIYEGGRWFFTVICYSGAFNFTVSNAGPSTSTGTGSTTSNPTSTSVNPTSTTANPTSTTAVVTTGTTGSTTVGITTKAVTTKALTTAAGTTVALTTSNTTLTTSSVNVTTTTGEEPSTTGSASSLVATSLFLLLLLALF